MSLKKGSFADSLQDDRLVNETLKKVPVTLRAKVVVGSYGFLRTATLIYTSKAGKSGKFK